MSKELPRAHLVGLDDSGMSGLAQILVQRGCVVSGSIPSLSPTIPHLQSIGVRVHAGHAPASAPRSARFLVYGRKVPREHPERLRAARQGVEQASCPEYLDLLLRQGLGITTVGGRSASVAAAMIGWTLAHAGLDPTVILARSSPQLGGCGRLGAGRHVVVDTEGAPLQGQGAEIVLVLDQDRIRDWVDAAPTSGYVLAPGDPSNESDDFSSSATTVERFSLVPGHAWWGADLREDRGRYRFRAFYRGRFAVEIQLQVPGRHHVLGALATVAICARVDLSSRAIKEALEEFGGVSRGFESRGSYRGVTLVDDEAPGPDAAGDAIEVARQVFGPRKLCVVYRPDPSGDGSWPSASEFQGVHRVLVVDEEGPSKGSMARDLDLALCAAGIRATRASRLDEAIRELDRHLEPGDVLVTLGAGDVGTIADAFLRRLSSDRHAG